MVAEVYDDGRTPYATAIFKRTASVVGLGPEHTALDLGCGPGTIAKVMAQYAGKVIGIDPSAGMVAVAQRNAPENAVFLQGSSYDMPQIDEPIRLVTMGRSFHWMDRAATLEMLDDLIEDNGGIAIFDESPLGGKAPENRWYWALQKMLKDYAPEGSFDETFLSSDFERNEFSLARSVFSNMSFHGVYRWHSWSYNRVLKYALSRSGTSVLALGDDLPEFERKLRKMLRRFGKGPWRTLNHHRVTIARRPPSASGT